MRKVLAMLGVISVIIFFQVYRANSEHLTKTPEAQKSPVMAEKEEDRGIFDPCHLDAVACDSEPIQAVVEAEAESEIIKTIIRKVYQLESSGGKRDSCLYKGKYNGYGYNSNRICFDNPEEARKIVAGWFEENLRKYSVPMALCRYNSGKAMDGCEYYENYKKLN